MGEYLRKLKDFTKGKEMMFLLILLVIVIVLLIIVYFNLLSDYDCLLHENASLRNDNLDLKAENLKLVSEKQANLDHAKKLFRWYSEDKQRTELLNWKPFDPIFGRRW